MFNVYTKKSGRLNTGKRRGVAKKNVVWDRPEDPPSHLEYLVNCAVEEIKAAERSGIKLIETPTPSERTSSLDSGVWSLEEEFSFLNI
jgi:hypothetical protein